MLADKVLASSAFLLLLVVQTRSCASELPVGRRLTTDDINESTCTKLLVSGDTPIEDSRITASSQYDGNHGPRRARIFRTVKGDLTGSWSSQHNNIHQWLQFDFGHARCVTGVVTKGRSQQYEQFVRSYRLQYSDNCLSWTLLKDQNDQVKTFEANFDGETPKVNTIDHGISARCIRILPRTWYSQISMRADVLGCV